MNTTYQERIHEELERFVAFGTVLDHRSRQYLAEYLLQKLDPRHPAPPDLSSVYYRYFCQVLDRIFASQPLMELIRSRPVLSAEITTEILHWVRRSHRRVQEKNPFYEEFQKLEALSVLPTRQLVARWHIYTDYLTYAYSGDELPAGFYASKYQEIICGRPVDALSSDEIAATEALTRDLLAQWDALLQGKRLEYELKKMEEEEESPFVERLEAMAESYHRLFDLISPFADSVGRYWDMSKGLWEDAGFEVLEKYRDLLADEPSLQELADMLGKMREAELITEEETIEQVIVRQEWLQDDQQRAEITGIHESDDLNHVLSSEIALLGDPLTETVFFKKFAEKELQTFRFEHRRLEPHPEKFTEVSRKVKKREKGPFIICVDTSDSMTGDPERIAKVLCFGILRMAARDNRRAFLVNFSVGVKTIDLFDLSRSLDDLIAFLRMSFHSGTDMTLALHEVFRQLDSESYRDADVLVISDFILYRFEEEQQARIRHHQRQRGTQFHSLVLSERPNEDVIACFDTNWQYDPRARGVVRELTHELAKKLR